VSPLKTARSDRQAGDNADARLSHGGTLQATPHPSPQLREERGQACRRRLHPEAGDRQYDHDLETDHRIAASDLDIGGHDAASCPLSKFHRFPAAFSCVHLWFHSASISVHQRSSAVPSPGGVHLRSLAVSILVRTLIPLCVLCALCGSVSLRISGFGFDSSLGFRHSGFSPWRFLLGLEKESSPGLTSAKNRVTCMRS